MTFQRWLENRWIVEHETSTEEVAELFALVERDLADSAIDGLSSDWRISIAYNAVLQLASLALAAEGYRPGRERAHERAIRSLVLTIDADPGFVETLDAIRRKRNLTNYERSGATSRREAEEIRAIAIGLRDAVVEWMRRRHPKLMTPEA